MTIPLIDVVAEYDSLRSEIDAALAATLQGGRWILGPEVGRLEADVAAALGAGVGVGVANGTDALVLSLMALGIGPGDEVLVPVYSFYATAEAVQRVGATPVFCDIRPDSYCIDVDDAAGRVTPATKAILPVHLYGHPADMDAVAALASKHGLAVVEDAAQAFGATWAGRPIGSFGTVACLSFFPTKNLGGFGDGGMVVTSDPELEAQVRLLRAHGSRTKHRPEVVGMNSRLDELQAAALLVKLPHVTDWNAHRREAAARYDAALEPLGVGVPAVVDGAEHVYHLYTIRSRDRERIAEALKVRDIASAVYYPQAMHLLPACAPLGGRLGDFPVAESLSDEVLALPMFSQITDEQVDAVIAAVATATEGAHDGAATA